MRNTSIVGILAVTLLLAACSGGSSPSKSPTLAAPTATVAAAPTSTPAPAPVPARPAALADYGSTIATYLSASPPAASNCLAELYAAWQLPVVNGCRLANTDGDTEMEIVVAVAQKPATGDAQDKVIVFDGSSGTYRVAYESPAFALDPAATLTTGPVLGIADINGGAPDIIYRSDACSAGICSTTVHVISGASGGAYVEQSPIAGITMESAEGVRLDDSGQIILTGRGGETPVTGPQRGRTETWAWTSGAFTVVNRQPAPAQYLYHAILDADALLVLGDYAGAQYAFIGAVQDKRLNIWRPDSRERAELESYGLFHAGLAVLLADGDPEIARQYFDQSRAYTTSLHAQLAGSFEAAYEAKGSISIGCGAALDDVQANGAEYAKFWDFGTSNPRFDPITICPY